MVIIMKFPKSKKMLCPKCNKHTEHTVKQAKKKGRGKAHPNCQAQRRFKRKLEGYGSFPRPNPKGEGKPTKRLDLRYTCKECGKASTRSGFKVKKFELT